LLTPLRLHHVVARARRAWEVELDTCLRRGGSTRSILSSFFTRALHLRGVAGARLEALDERLLLLQHRLLPLELRLLLHVRGWRAGCS
jgi:hypothetical protein